MRMQIPNYYLLTDLSSDLCKTARMKRCSTHISGDIWHCYRQLEVPRIHSSPKGARVLIALCSITLAPPCIQLQCIELDTVIYRPLCLYLLYLSDWRDKHGICDPITAAAPVLLCTSPRILVQHPFTNCSLFRSPIHKPKPLRHIFTLLHNYKKKVESPSILRIEG